MALWMNRNTQTFSQMGGEGVAWVGQQPFCRDTHVFANLGDGTYFHSGLLAIRQSIAAGVNITYKVLYNDAVAMTGGQRVGERAQGHTVLQIMHSLHAEGASKLVIVTNAPEKYAGVPLAAGVRVQHRDALERIQLELRTVPGTSVIIYDQTCATEKRRRRKRGHLTESDQYVVINAQVCEGCGDCGEVSNCLSVEPLETEFGRKRSINTSTCNHDLSCLKGFCPSFVTVKGGRLRKPDKHSQSALGHLADLPAPVWQTCNPVCSIVVAGIGGTGVITVGQVLGMAAHLDGKSVVTQDAGGLAQKGGATWSHVQFAAAPDAIFTSKVDHARADLVLGCDAVVAASATTLAVMQSGRTYVALNTHATPTASFVHQPDWQSAHAACTESIRSYVGAQALGMLDAQWVARKALGDSIYSNPLLLGYAWQQGRIPLSLAALMRAMEINGVQVQDNQLAFAWGRQCAHNLRAVLALFGDAVTRPANQQPSQEQCIALRVDHLTRYQNAAYAAGYLTLVRQVQQIDARWGADALSDAVAHNLCKVMAYKDEYEVARLYTDGLFAEQIATQFEGAYQLHFHLAPPGWAKKNANGELIKQTWGPATLRLLKWLARLKFLRGTVLDVFGRASERQQERRLIEDYRSCIGELLGVLAAGPDQPGAHERYALAVRIARVPEQIRGFGHVKARHQVAADTEWKTLMADFRQKV